MTTELVGGGFGVVWVSVARSQVARDRVGWCAAECCGVRLCGAWWSVWCRVPWGRARRGGVEWG